MDDLNRLGETLGEMGAALARAERYAEALPLLEEAVQHHRAAFQKGPDVPSYRRFLRAALVHLADACRRAGRNVWVRRAAGDIVHLTY